jgi:hypothetical protein
MLNDVKVINWILYYIWKVVVLRDIQNNKNSGLSIKRILKLICEASWGTQYYK